MLKINNYQKRLKNRFKKIILNWKSRKSSKKITDPLKICSGHVSEFEHNILCF